jgi:hypothetical protein
MPLLLTPPLLPLLLPLLGLPVVPPVLLLAGVLPPPLLPGFTVVPPAWPVPSPMLVVLLPGALPLDALLLLLAISMGSVVAPGLLLLPLLLVGVAPAVLSAGGADVESEAGASELLVLATPCPTPAPADPSAAPA